MNREVHVRICESAGVKFPRATRLEIVMALEEEFGIEISDKDASRLKTIGDVLNYVKKSLEESSQKAEDHQQ